jgi:hypothetical protein
VATYVKKKKEKEKKEKKRKEKKRKGMAWSLHDSEEVRLGYCVCVVAYICRYGR